jgi:tetratricopeptide (TPR) repeat protein
VARILVAPFETPARDGRTYWLGEAVAILIAEDVNARKLGAITRSARERAYDQLHLPPNAVLSQATVIKVGQLAGAAQVIVGNVQVEGDTLTIHARPIRIDIGRADAEITERGDLKDLFAVAQRVAGRAVPGGSGSSSPAPSLQAFEQYVKGLLAEQPESQRSFLEAALKLDPGYDKARLALWDTRTTLGDHAAALAAVRGVPNSAPLSRRARFKAAVSLISLKQYDEAFTMLTALNSEAEEPAILNNLGIVQLRRGAPPQTGKPEFFLTKAAKVEPNDPDLLFNLGYAYASDRDPQAAIYWVREALRRNPADSESHVVLAFALDAAGSLVEAAKERELAAQLSSRYAESAHHAAFDPLPRGLDRVRQDLEPRDDGGVDLAIVNTAQRDQQDAAQFHLDRGRRLFEREQDREAMAELRRAVFLSPYEAEAHLLIGRIYLRAGRPQEAIGALKISIWSRDGAPAHVALAEAYLDVKDTANARLQAQRALTMDPSSADAKRLLDRLDRSGRNDPGSMQLWLALEKSDVERNSVARTR